MRRREPGTQDAAPSPSHPRRKSATAAHAGRHPPLTLPAHLPQPRVLPLPRTPLHLGRHLPPSILHPGLPRLAARSHHSLHHRHLFRRRHHPCRRRHPPRHTRRDRPHRPRHHHRPEPHRPRPRPPHPPPAPTPGPPTIPRPPHHSQ